MVEHTSSKGTGPGSSPGGNYLRLFNSIIRSAASGRQRIYLFFFMAALPPCLHLYLFLSHC